MGRGGANSDVGQLIIVFAVGYLALTGGLTGIGEWINGLIPPPPPVNPHQSPPPGENYFTTPSGTAAQSL